MESPTKQLPTSDLPSDGGGIVPSLSDDRKLAFFVASYYFIQLTNTVLKTVLPISASAWNIMSYGFMAVLALLLVRALKPMLHRIGPQFIVVEAVFALLLCITLLRGTATQSFIMNKVLWCLGVSIPVAFCAGAIQDKSVLYDYLVKLFYAVVALDMVSIYGIVAKNGYSMSITMTSLPILLVGIDNTISKRSFANMACSIAGIVFIMVFGNRGAIACLVFFFVVKIVMSSMKASSRILIAGLIIGAFAAILLFANEIIDGISSVAAALGFKTYTIRRLLSGTLLVSSSRETLTQYYSQMVMDSPVFGYGLYGGWIADGSGPHNGLMELLLGFGVLVGGLLIVLLILSFVKAVVRAKRADATSKLTVCFASACFTSMISASLGLTTPTMPLFLVLCWLGTQQMDEARAIR